MSAAASDSTPIEAPRSTKRGVVAWLALAAVALTIATSGVVFTEPAPIDILTIGLIVLLPVDRPRAVQSRPCSAYWRLWLVAAPAPCWPRPSRSIRQQTMTHVGVTLYLYAATFVFAAFIAHSPRAHTELILKAWTCGRADRRRRRASSATSACCRAPTTCSRATIAPAVRSRTPTCSVRSSSCRCSTCSARLSIAPLRSVILPLGVAGFLMLAVFLSFSRGAWINLVLALGDLRLPAAGDHVQRAPAAEDRRAIGARLRHGAPASSSRPPAPTRSPTSSASAPALDQILRHRLGRPLRRTGEGGRPHPRKSARHRRAGVRRRGITPRRRTTSI